MKIYKEKQSIIVDNIKDFDLSQTMECGQCFHFEKIDENRYGVVAYSSLSDVYQIDDKLYFDNTDIDTVKNIWIPYFDLERDYRSIKKTLLEKDNKLKDAINEKDGIRLLNAEFHENLLSFIISQNKQIPHIKKIVADISAKYGEMLGSINNKDYYAFPEIEDLVNISVEEFRKLKTGFRAPYLVDASNKMYEGVIDENELRKIGYEKAKEKLISIKGVGEKVANCVLLFSLGYRNSFPVDVWIKRIMEALYFNGKYTSKEEIEKLANEKYGIYGGYAQQYLFSYGKDLRLGK